MISFHISTPKEDDEAVVVDDDDGVIEGVAGGVSGIVGAAAEEPETGDGLLALDSIVRLVDARLEVGVLSSDAILPIVFELRLSMVSSLALDFDPFLSFFSRTHKPYHTKSHMIAFATMTLEET
jgi:hypothetical protein